MVWCVCWCWSVYTHQTHWFDLSSPLSYIVCTNTLLSLTTTVLLWLEYFRIEHPPYSQLTIKEIRSHHKSLSLTRFFQVNGKCPTVSIDKTDGCQVYLSKESISCEIVSAKSSEMNICIPKPDGEFVSVSCDPVMMSQLSHVIPS